MSSDRRQRAMCDGVAITCDRATPECVGALCEALRAAGLAGTTLWVGTSGLPLPAELDDAGAAAAAVLVATVARAERAPFEPAGLPYS